MIYAFGGFRLDTERKELWRGTELVTLRPRPLQLLACLARQGGRWVSTEELRREVWQGVFVTDDGLRTAIRGIRRELDVGDRSLIGGRRRIGYRLEARVEGRCSGAESEPADEFLARPKLAVLLFRVFSEEPGYEFLASALDDDVTSRLAARRVLPLIAHQSVIGYAGSSKSAGMISEAAWPIPP